MMGLRRMRSGVAALPRLCVAATLLSCLITFQACHSERSSESQPSALSLQTDDAQWVMPAKDYASRRYSQLSEINTSNAARMRLAWTFSTGSVRGEEAAPLVVGDAMYIVTPYPNNVFALDLRHPGTTKWSYGPKAVAAAKGVACCDQVNRGMAYSAGRLFLNTLDGRTIALDAKSGRELWVTRVADYLRGETITMAPLVVKDKVLVGDSGGEFGVRGNLAALDTATGKIVWRAYSTGPDRDVLIGPSFKPFYPDQRGQDLGVKTWPQGRWQTGGGAVWGWISYDPSLDLIYYGTSNPGPWNPEQRPGDNKWTATVFARDPDTGEARWAYQYNPHDVTDYDGVNEHVLLDLEWKGQKRKVLVHPDRNGYVYVLDRVTGEVLSASPYGPITNSYGVDLATGRLRTDPSKATGPGKLVSDLCPAAPGAKDWQPSAFSPRNGVLYIPQNNLCQDVEGAEVKYIAGTPFVGATLHIKAGPGGNRGWFTGWDVVNGRALWRIPEKFPVWSGALVTAGDVAFYGTMDGWFKAIDARNGTLLWQFKAPSGIIGQPVTYRGPDGHQYVAVLSGVGGWAGAVVAGDLDPRDGTGAGGMLNAMGDLKDATTKGGTLLVFSL